MKHNEQKTILGLGLGASVLTNLLLANGNGDLKAALAALKTTEADLRRAFDGLRERHGKLEKSYASLQAAHVELEERCTKLGDDLAAGRVTNDEVTQEREGLLRELEASRHELAKGLATAEKLQAEARGEREAREKLEAKVTQLEAERASPVREVPKGAKR